MYLGEDWKVLGTRDLVAWSIDLLAQRGSGLGTDDGTRQRVMDGSYRRTLLRRRDGSCQRHLHGVTRYVRNEMDPIQLEYVADRQFDSRFDVLGELG